MGPLSLMLCCRGRPGTPDNTPLPNKMPVPVPLLTHCVDYGSADYDCLVLVGQDYKECGDQAVISVLEPVLAIDEGAKSGGCVVPVSLPCGRLVYSPTGPPSTWSFPTTGEWSGQTPAELCQATEVQPHGHSRKCW